MNLNLIEGNTSENQAIRSSLNLYTYDTKYCRWYFGSVVSVEQLCGPNVDSSIIFFSLTKGYLELNSVLTVRLQTDTVVTWHHVVIKP